MQFIVYYIGLLCQGKTAYDAINEILPQGNLEITETAA